MIVKFIVIFHEKSDNEVRHTNKFFSSCLVQAITEGLILYGLVFQI
jgi:hypothetical protein